MIDRKNKYLELTRKIVLECLKDNNVKVFLFGSRAKDQHTHDSDIDIGFTGFTDSAQSHFRKIRDALENFRFELNEGTCTSSKIIYEL